MESTDVEKSASSEETGQLNRNRSFKSKQLVRSQAIRESQSPPRTSPLPSVTPTSPTPSVANTSPAPSVANTSPAPSVANTSPTPSVADVTRSDANVTRSDACERANESSHISVSSDVKYSNSDIKKKLPVEIQEGGYRRGARDRALLSHGPRTACVCGACAACPHCRGRRRRPPCPTKQDSGIVCSDDCPDCSDDIGAAGIQDVIKKANSVDADDQYCRCPERKERTKNVSLTRNDSDDRNEISGPELVSFIKDTLNKNPRDRIALLKIEKELHALVNDTGRCIVRFPVMTSYGRMLVHRCAALFQLSHHLDQTNKTSVLVSKSGTSGGRLPCTSFRSWCTAHFAPSPRHLPDVPAKSILKRDTQSLDEPGSGAMAGASNKSLEQRERDYERVRRRIFSEDNCSHREDGPWPWLSGPVRVLAAEGRNKLLKVQSLEGEARGARRVSKSHSFGGYGAPPPRLLSRQGDLASSSWRLSPSSSGYKTLSLRSTDSITPSPTGGASPEPAGCEPGNVVWAVTDMSAVPPGAVVIHPQTGRALTNADGSVYHFDPHNPPALTHKVDQNDKRRGRLEKQHSFMDNDTECRPHDECRNKCCCECRRHDATRDNCDKEITKNQLSPSRYDVQTNAQEPKYETTNQKPEHFEPANQRQDHFEPTNHRQEHFDATNQRQEQYEPTNHKPMNLENANQRSFERFESNQRAGNDNINSRQVPNHEEVQYQYQPGFRPEEMTSPPQIAAHYLPPEAVTSQAKLPPMALPDPNIRSLTNMSNVVYPNVPQGYPYPCRVDPHVPMYQPLVPTEEPKMAPHHNNETFRIDPSYPYTAVDYNCGACVDTNVMPPQRSYSVPFGQMEVPVLGQYPMHNVMLPQPQIQPYQYPEGVPWAGVGQPKLMMPEVFPVLQYPPAYTHYNIVYPQVIPQAYPVCQPMYPVIDRTDNPTPNNSAHNPVNNSAHNSVNNSALRNSKRNSTNNSARATPNAHDKVPYDVTRHDKPPQHDTRHFDSSRHSDSRQSEHRQNLSARQNAAHRSERAYDERSFERNRHNTQDVGESQDAKKNNDLNAQSADSSNEIAAKIQQIKNQMEQMNTRDRRKDGVEWRRNSGSGLLGTCPISSVNGKPMGRPINDEAHLSSAARAIVNSIRNMQSKNTYEPDPRREHGRYDAVRRDADVTAAHLPLFRHTYLLRQMSPGTWCRRSPAPVHPVLNHPRRPPPDTRNPRR